VINRRRFMTGAGLLGPVVLADRAASLGRPCSTGNSTERPSQVIIDPRHPASVALAVAASQGGQLIHRVDGDLTALWRDTLQSTMAERRGSIAGCLPASGAFCLEEMSRQYWWRTTYRIEHQHQADDSLSHRITSAPEHLTTLVTAVAGRTDWAERLATISTGGSLRPAEVRSLASRTIGSASRPSGRVESWISFLISA
jgi:hypothetical protein